MELDNWSMESAQAWGADFFGVADLSPAHDAILAQGGPAIADYPRAVSLGIGLLHAIVDQLPRRAERAIAANYRYHAYELINQRLDLIASRLSACCSMRDTVRCLSRPRSEWTT